jgi:hypothetical protein
MTTVERTVIQRHAYRRKTGLIMGAVIGLAYGAVSQGVNHVLLPGMALYQPPFGMAGNMFLAVLLGAIFGAASAWPEAGFKGVFLSSLLGAVAISIPTLLTGNMNPELWPMKSVAVLLIFVPTGAVLAPFLIFFRWLVVYETEASFGPPTWQRTALGLGIILAAGGLGLFGMYPEQGRQVLPRMQALIQAGVQSGGGESLPAPLRPEGVLYFQSQAQGAYSLEWDSDPTNRFAIPRPATSPFDQSIAIAHFENGYLLVCMYPNLSAEPECRDFAARE